MGAISVSGLTSLGNDSTTPSTNNVTYWTYSDDLTYTRGRHLLKSGVLVEHAFSSKQTTTNSRGAYTFANLTTFLAGTARQRARAPNARAGDAAREAKRARADGGDECSARGRDIAEQVAPNAWRFRVSVAAGHSDRSVRSRWSDRRCWPHRR